MRRLIAACLLALAVCALSVSVVSAGGHGIGIQIFRPEER